MGIRRLQLTNNNIEQNTNYDKYRRWQANEQSKVGGNLRILLPCVRCACAYCSPRRSPTFQETMLSEQLWHLSAHRIVFDVTNNQVKYTLWSKKKWINAINNGGRASTTVLTDPFLCAVHPVLAACNCSPVTATYFFLVSCEVGPGDG